MEGIALRAAEAMATVRVDVEFTEQRLRVQLNLQQVQGSVQVDRVEPQSAAHGRVAPGATLVAVNGERIRPLIGRQAWVAFCERVKNTPRPMTLTFEQAAPAGTVAVPPAAAPAATASTPAPAPAPPPAAAPASTTEEEEEEPALVCVPRKTPKAKKAPAPRAPPAPAPAPAPPPPAPHPFADAPATAVAPPGIQRFKLPADAVLVYNLEVRYGPGWAQPWGQRPASGESVVLCCAWEPHVDPALPWQVYWKTGGHRQTERVALDLSLIHI